ncbi:MAG TPA: V-type ATPase subunit [Candidatus Hydrogenedentes bacterium]|nr:V-type ATPase subunit [Candidatus Hydrogenedentota bacterium]
MNQHQWGFACGRISALEGQLLPEDLFHALAPLERVEDIFNRLQDTFLRDYMPSGGVHWTDWTSTIDTYFIDQTLSLRQDLPIPALADLFLLPFDYMNLKRAVLNRGQYPFGANVFSTDRLSDVAGGDASLLPDELRPLVASLAAIGGGEGESALLTDMALDGAYLRHVLAIAREVDAPLVSACLDLLVLGRAVVVLWRGAQSGQSLKRYERHFLPISAYNGVLEELIATSDTGAWRPLIPGAVGDVWEEAQQSAEEDQIMHFEQLLADRITALARQGKLQTAGPERVFGYLWALSVEGYNLKLIISGRVNGVDPDLLKRRLRACYV